MVYGKRQQTAVRFTLLLVAAFLIMFGFVSEQRFQAASHISSAVATYSQGMLRLTVPYQALHAGTGEFIVEVLNPEDQPIGRAEQRIKITTRRGQLQSEVRLDTPLAVDDLVWHRVRYGFEYDDAKKPALEGTESISQILSRPVIHILGQQSYIAGAKAAVRVIVTDSNDNTIPDPCSIEIQLLDAGNKLAEDKHRSLFSGRLNRRGTMEAQFRFPAGMAGNYKLRYVADTPIGSTEFTQDVLLKDKISILLTSEKPLYQPGQTIHVRALALDRANHEASAKHPLTFELEDSRGNKVFKAATTTDQFGVASAGFTLADEVNLGTYHLRALMGDADAPTNTAELALNVERYVLPKFKVAVEFSENGKKQKRGYRPGDHATGTVRANYFFGKPVDHAELTIKASAMDVTVAEVASAKGKTDSDGSYHFDLALPKYFAGRPLDHGAVRVLIEAAVKDSAGHSETRGQPITVSDSPLLITAIPEGGTLVPNLQNQVFILTAYPDGTPARADLIVRSSGNEDQHASTDDGGVAIIAIKAKGGKENDKEALQIEARDREGNQASSEAELESRAGEDQILLRTERAVYRAGEKIQLKVFSTKARGAAYVDIVKEGQTVLTRDLDLENGEAELSLTASPEMAGTVDISAYLFGRNAESVGDHRLIFVQPADELKIETTADAPVYKPGNEARIKFRVTNSHGEGVHAALGLQVVDEAVFALAEKQPGFAKVFFYLEQQVMKPRYEIHSIGMPEIVEVETSQASQRDLAARALFSATEIVTPNKFETKAGKDVPMTKYANYRNRYQARLLAQANEIAGKLSQAYSKDAKAGSPAIVYAKLAESGDPAFRDPWGHTITLEPMRWNRSHAYYSLRSAGPDGQLNTSEDLRVSVLSQVGWIAQPAAGASGIGINIERERGAFNGRAEITGVVADFTGAVIAGASVELRSASGKARPTATDAAGRFNFSGLPDGDYTVEISAPGFKSASGRFILHARDRAILSATLSVGQATEQVMVEAGAQLVETEDAALGQNIAAGIPGGAAGGVIANRQMQALPINGRNFSQFAAKSSGVLAKDAGESPSAHVRSYFPEALYINPEIITDKDGRASIVIPIADSITAWRMAMIASTQQGALGTSTSSLKVFQDFFVDLDLPVTLTQGDRVSIPVAIYNYSNSRGDVNLKLQADDWFSLVDDSAEKSVTVDSARVGNSQFTLDANRIGKFKLTLSAHMRGHSDRADIVVREIEVIPNGREQNAVFNGRLEKTVQHDLNFPADSIPEASKIFVRLYPGPMSQVVEGMDAILRMPGGCFEQTSSSTYPNVLALDYMKRTKKLTPEVHAKAEGFIANGYQRLLTFEVPGGGFSWFGQAPANKILTAYGLMEFYDMSKVHDVDPKLISRTQDWLASQQQEDGSWKPDTQFINEGATNRYNSDLLRITAYIAWSLGNTGYRGPAVEKAKRFVEKHMMAKVDTYTLAVVANFAADYKEDREFTRQAIQMLLDARTEKDEQIWWDAEETNVHATGQSASVETTGLAVQALLKSGEAPETARKALNYIASKKDAYGTWGTTQATIMALRALLTSTEKGTADVRGTVTVLLNGNAVEKLELTPENNDLLHQFVFKDKGIEVGGASTVALQFEGKGGLAYQIVGNYYLPWDKKPADEPLSIDIAYDRTSLAQNDIATASVIVKNNLDKAAKMVMVDLGIPPGFDILSEDLQDYQAASTGRKSGHLSKFSLTATQALLYFDSIAPGDKVTFKYRLRAKYPIRARTFKSRVYEYYDPEVSSISRPVQMEVRNR